MHLLILCLFYSLFPFFCTAVCPLKLIFNLLLHFPPPFMSYSPFLLFPFILLLEFKSLFSRLIQCFRKEIKLGGAPDLELQKNTAGSWVNWGLSSVPSSGVLSLNFPGTYPGVRTWTRQQQQEVSSTPFAGEMEPTVEQWAWLPPSTLWAAPSTGPCLARDSWVLVSSCLLSSALFLTAHFFSGFVVIIFTYFVLILWVFCI